MTQTTEQREFKKLVSDGHPVGEVMGVDRFLIGVYGLQPVTIHALVMFEDGSQGYVHHIDEDRVVVMHLGVSTLRVGMVAVVRSVSLVTGVGKNYIGRVISATGTPLDGKGDIDPDAVWPVFNNAPMLYERELLDTQLETGVTSIDSLFPFVRGQRMALLGDSKSGKTTLAAQIALHQSRADITPIYVLIAKKQSDITTLITRLEAKKALASSIVIVSTMSDSLPVSYLVPYIGCAMGEYLWQTCNMDTLVIYDDLTTHAQVYREMSLLSGVSPGRDSYPGDIFYAHSSLVERAGKLASNHKSQTILPLVYAAGGDVTAYLPTNVMSMTDGQWILDMKVFNDALRPAISTGLSVTRVGGVGQNAHQKELSGRVLKAITAYYKAQEFSHFGSDIGENARRDLEVGRRLFEVLSQAPDETYTFMEQQLMLDIVLDYRIGEDIVVATLKSLVARYAAQVKEVKKDSNYTSVRDDLKHACLGSGAKQ